MEGGEFREDEWRTERGVGACVIVSFMVSSKRRRHMEQQYCCVVCDMKQHLELQD